MRVDPENLSGNLERGLSPVYLVGGDELLIVQECVDMIRKKARENGFTERVVLFAESGFNWLDLNQASESQSLFAEGKIIELRIPSGKPGREGSLAITEYLAGDNDTNVLLVTCDKMDKATSSTKWVQAIDQKGVFVHVWPIRPAQLPGWIRQRMQALDLVPDGDAVQMLAERLEGNLLAANQEIQKLKLLKGSGNVSVGDVRDCVTDSARFDIFRLIECAYLGQLGLALRIVAGLKAAGAELPMLVGALVWELGSLEQVRALTANGMPPDVAFRQTRIWQNRQKPMRAALDRLADDDVHRCLALLANLDLQSKGGADGDPWITLDDLVSCLAGRARAVITPA